MLMSCLLPVLVSSHQRTLLEAFKCVRFSAVEFQSCTKVCEGLRESLETNTLIQDVLSFPFIHAMGHCGPKPEPGLVLLVGHAGADITRQDTPAAFTAPVSAPLLPTRWKEDGPSCGQHLGTLVPAGLLSSSCKRWPVAHLLVWGLYDGIWRAAVAPGLEPSAVASGSRSVSSWAWGSFRLLHSDAQMLGTV